MSHFHKVISLENAEKFFTSVTELLENGLETYDLLILKRSRRLSYFLLKQNDSS